MSTRYAEEVKRQAFPPISDDTKVDPNELKASMNNARKAVDIAVKELEGLEEAMRGGRKPCNGGFVARMRGMIGKANPT